MLYLSFFDTRTCVYTLSYRFRCLSVSLFFARVGYLLPTHECTVLTNGYSLYRTTIIVLDASTKGSSGLMDGSITGFGDYYQCLDINYQEEEAEENGNQGEKSAPLLLEGKHCMIQLAFERSKDKGKQDNATKNDAMTVEEYLDHLLPVFDYHHIHQALCLPAACNGRDLKQMLDKGEALQT